VSLRIPLTAVRCNCGEGRRVRFQHGSKCVTPEGLVLRRWKDRTQAPLQEAAGIVFDGCRLPPGTWRVLLEAESCGLALNQPFDRDQLMSFIDRVRRERPELRAPQVDKFLGLLDWLRGRGVLVDMVRRERSAESPGIPDLFLFRRDRTGRVHGGRFVEVKRATTKPYWREPLSASQREEMQFLNEQGLKATVAYVLEGQLRQTKRL
jgi:VRR-NUC domain-containing protein